MEMTCRGKIESFFAYPSAELLMHYVALYYTRRDQVDRFDDEIYREGCGGHAEEVVEGAQWRLYGTSKL